MTDTISPDAAPRLVFAKKVTMKCPVSTDNKPNLDWGPFFFCLKGDDTYRLYFAKTKEDRVTGRIQLSDGISFALREDKILYISFHKPDDLLACHFLDRFDKVAGLPPMFLRCEYCSEEDALMIYFVDPNQYTGTFCSRSAQPPYQNDIFFYLDANERISSLEILSATRLIEKPTMALRS